MNIRQIEKATKIIEKLKELDKIALAMERKSNELGSKGGPIKVSFSFPVEEKIDVDAEYRPSFSMFSSMMSRHEFQCEPKTNETIDIEISDVFTFELFGVIYRQLQKEREVLIKQLEKFK